jgi:hypothetical protein
VEKMELQMGIEPMTSPLPRECSTTEPLKLNQCFSISKIMEGFDCVKERLFFSKYSLH